MKKAVVYMAAALLALSAMTGCGKAGEQGGNASPTPTGTPMVATPDANNGIVQDDDGIITDDDTGRVDTDKSGVTGGQTHDADTALSPTPGTDEDTHTGGSPIPGGNTGASAVAPSASPATSAGTSGGKNG